MYSLCFFLLNILLVKSQLLTSLKNKLRNLRTEESHCYVYTLLYQMFSNNA